MKKILLPILMLIFISACCPEPKEMTIDEINKEKAAIVQVIKDFNKAAEDKNFSKIVETLAGEVIFFGTDSDEVIKTFADFKKKMFEQWEHYDRMVYGEPSDISIQLDKEATFATVIFGIPCEITLKGKTENLFLRVARILKKENNKWVIVSGIAGVTRSGDTMEGIDSAAAMTAPDHLPQ